MLAALLAAAAVVRSRAVDELAADVALLEAVLDHERRANPIARISDISQVGDGQGDYTPVDGEYLVFNSDEEATEYFTDNGVFTEDPSSTEINPKWTKMDIVFSFGAADNGFGNVVSLADTLLEKHQLNSYIDAKYLPNEEGSYLIPDTRQDSGYSFPRNVNWKAWYKRAMLDAPTMIFIVTEAWINSPFCAEELGWAIGARMAKGYLNIIVAEPKFLGDHNTPVQAALLGKLTDLFFTIQDPDNGQTIPNPTSIEFHVVPYAGTTDDKLTETVNGIAGEKDPVEYMRSITGYVQVTSSASGSSLAITFTDANGAKRSKVEM